jgi:uncharacterized protein
MIRRMALVLFTIAAGLSGSALGQDARELVLEALKRHALPPHVYEEQTLVLGNATGQYTVRTARFYAQRDEGGQRRLLVLDTPAELRGISIQVARNAQGEGRVGPAPASPVFGSDFSVADFEGEQPQDFTYRSENSQDLDRVSHHVVRASPRDETVRRETGYAERLIFLRKDNLFVSRIDYLDRQGRPAKRRTFRDPRPDESGAWRPGMILTEDLREERRTLLKVDRRVHSADYVPNALFAGLR